MANSVILLPVTPLAQCQAIFHGGEISGQPPTGFGALRWGSFATSHSQRGLCSSSTDAEYSGEIL